MEGRRLPRDDDRGQAHTLEAVVGALLLLASVLFALQSTAVTPLSASTSSQHIENQQRETAQGLLAAAAANESLRPAVLYVDNASGGFHDTDAGQYYVSQTPDTPFGRMLNGTLASRGLAYNVYLEYQAADNTTDSQRYIFRGTPTDNAVSASWTVVLRDSDTLYYENGTKNEGAALSDPDTDFFAPDVSPSTELYNLVRVEVVVWRV